MASATLDAIHLSNDDVATQRDTSVPRLRIHRRHAHTWTMLGEMTHGAARWPGVARMRRVLRRLALATRFAGQRVTIDPTAYVSRKAVIRARDGGSVSIGANCEIHDFAVLLPYGGAITIGENSSVNPFTIVYGHGGTTIGKGVRIAAHCVIIPSNHVRGDDERPGLLRGVTARGIHIDDYAWLGAGCRILDGVRIGRHAIIGAGSVVTRSIPDSATAVGVPARVVEQPEGGAETREIE